jgi:gamma-glutamyltranspeptidase / glutathione hydrolase
MNKTLAVLFVALLWVGDLAAQSVERTPVLPEGSSSLSHKPGWATQNFAVAAANPLAVQAGYQILQAGGSAVDAAVAVQMVLTLVEPQSSGIGGGAFLLHFNGQQTEAFDGRETAPSNVTERLFLGADGQALSFQDVVVGGRAVGTPGTVRMLELAHRQHGKLAWKQLFEPAIALAEGGFKVSTRMRTLLARESRLKLDPVAAAYFYDRQGKAWPEGHVLKNPELGAVFRRLAEQGSRALYEGEIAQAIVDKVQQHPSNPGVLSLADLAGYQAKKRAPLCFDHEVKTSDSTGSKRKNYLICGMPPPSSGAIAIGQILGLLGELHAESLPPEQNAKDLTPSADWLHLYTEASRLAFADRALYLGDPDFVAPPAGNWMSLLEPAYLAHRAQLIASGPGTKRMESAPPGLPGGIQSSFAPMPEQPEYGTSHISIVDSQGNALAMTTSIEDGWGARQMVNRGQGLTGGFLLNNELTDFSFSPTDSQGALIANRVQPGKRPRSSMSPTLVFDRDTSQLVLSAGSPGGAYIIHFVTKTLYGVLHWGLDAQAAISLPNFAAFEGPVLLEARSFSAASIKALKERGHSVIELPLASGIQAIQSTAHGWFGGADPRREGVVMGD